MKCEIWKEFKFEAAHRLPNVHPSHKCYRLHGHSYRFRVYIAEEVDPVLGWICDFGDVKKAVRPLLEQLDHHYLNEIPGLENPTSENLAVWLAYRLRGVYGVVAVEVMETCTSGAKVTL